LGHKKWQVTYIAPLNHVPLLCSHPGGLAGAGRIRLAGANVNFYRIKANFCFN